MSIDPGLGTVQPAVGSQGFFTRWGAVAQLRSIWNTIVPVAVVDRWRGDDDGSVRGITAVCNGNVNEYPCVVFLAPTGQPGKSDVIFEVDLVSFRRWVSQDPGNFIYDLHLFSPEAAYNPIQNLSPIGIYNPGFSTHPNANWGSVVGLGGTNPALGSYVGWTMQKRTSPTTAAGWWHSPSDTHPKPFNPPIRVFPGYMLAFQYRSKMNPGYLAMLVTMLYREIPV